MFKNLIIFSFTLFIISCGNEEKPKGKRDVVVPKDTMINRNKEWAIQERAVIDDYVSRKQWNVITTGTGLRYVIYQHGDTLKPTAKDGQIVTVDYKIYLLENDSLCYASEGIPESFKVAMDNVESGLHEAMSYLRVGDKAKIILPSYLAFGLIGDMDKVPPQSPLVYDIFLLKIADE